MKTGLVRFLQIVLFIFTTEALKKALTKARQFVKKSEAVRNLYKNCIPSFDQAEKKRKKKAEKTTKKKRKLEKSPETEVKSEVEAGEHPETGESVSSVLKL